MQLTVLPQPDVSWKPELSTQLHSRIKDSLYHWHVILAVQLAYWMETVGSYISGVFHSFGPATESYLICTFLVRSCRNNLSLFCPKDQSITLIWSCKIIKEHVDSDLMKL